MLKYIFLSLSLVSTIILSAGCFSDDCVQTLEFGAGWRRDSLDWNVNKIRSSYLRHTKVKSHIKFDDIDMWTVNGKASWYGSCYYARLSGMYAQSDKGRAKQDFNLRDHSVFSSDVSVSTSNPIKRRSEFYDFDFAIGYPLNFFCCRLSFIPTIGYTYDRQRIRVKEEHDSSSSSSHSHHYHHHHNNNDNDKNLASSSSSSSSSSSFYFSPSSSSHHHHHHHRHHSHHHRSDPFSSPSHANIASSLDLHNEKESCNYRFSWYGPYLGADIAYALDTEWLLFAELKGRFLNNCHQKRKSWTGVYFVDDYHRESWAYGFDGTLGTNYTFCTCWYASLNIDFKWMKAHATHDDLHWKTVGANLWVGYNF